MRNHARTKFAKGWSGKRLTLSQTQERVKNSLGFWGRGQPSRLFLVGLVKAETQG